MQIFTKILAVAAAVGLSAGAAQAAFDYTDTTSRDVYLDSEGLQDISCRNLFNNPQWAGLPSLPAPVAPCNPLGPPPGVGCPPHPNNRTADLSCNVYASSAPSAIGPYFSPITGTPPFVDPPGIKHNDYWAVASYIGTPPCTLVSGPGSCVWRFTAPIPVWGEVLQRTLGQVGAGVTGVPAPLDMIIDFSAATPAGSVVAAAAPNYYLGTAKFGPTPLGLAGIAPNGAVDATWFGQSQNPTLFSVPDAGVPLQYSCNDSGTVVPPLDIGVVAGGGPIVFTEAIGGAGLTTLTDASGAIGTICAGVAAGVPGACGASFTVRILSAAAPNGAEVGRVIDITSSSFPPPGPNLTLALPVSLTAGDTFAVELFGTATGAPFPQGINAGLCSNSIGDVAGLPLEPGLDLGSLPATTQFTTFVSAWTTVGGLGGSPLTNPVWAPFDMRLDEGPGITTDSDSDGIPDPFDNCNPPVPAPADITPWQNGPLADKWQTAILTDGCYIEFDGNGVSVVPGSPTAVGFVQEDADGDGYGDPCDADFDQTNNGDFNDLTIFTAELGTAGPSGTDMNCSGNVDFGDLTPFSAALGAPGPSGLYCAGVPPTVAPCKF